MGEKNEIINYEGLKYIIIKKTIYLGKEYIFVINYDNPKDIKILVCLNTLEEVNDLTLIKNIISQM